MYEEKTGMNRLMNEWMKGWMRRGWINEWEGNE